MVLVRHRALLSFAHHQGGSSERRGCLRFWDSAPAIAYPLRKMPVPRYWAAEMGGLKTVKTESDRPARRLPDWTG